MVGGSARITVCPFSRTNGNLSRGDLRQEARGTHGPAPAWSDARGWLAAGRRLCGPRGCHSGQPCVGLEPGDHCTDWGSSDRETNAPPHTNANGNPPADADATSHADTNSPLDTDTNSPPDTDADDASHADGNPCTGTSTNTAADALPNPDGG